MTAGKPRAVVEQLLSCRRQVAATDEFPFVVGSKRDVRRWGKPTAKQKGVVNDNRRAEREQDLHSRIERAQGGGGGGEVRGDCKR